MKPTRQLFACAVLAGTMLAPCSYADTTGGDPKPDSATFHRYQTIPPSVEIAIGCLLACLTLLGGILIVRRQ